MKKIISIALACILVLMAITLTGCNGQTTATDTQRQLDIARDLEREQPTPTDIDFSLERYNGIRRAYWVNGQREKAISLPCPVIKPMGYIILLTENGGILGRFIVDGKVSSLNSYLSPDSEYYEKISGSTNTTTNKWLSDVDGSYGVNDNGIYFFTPDGKYLEWTGTYLYSDIPFEVEQPILKIEGGN